MKRYLAPASRLALSIDLRPRQAKEKCLFVDLTHNWIRVRFQALTSQYVAPFTSSLLRVEHLGPAKSLIFDTVWFSFPATVPTPTSKLILVNSSSILTALKSRFFGPPKETKIALKRSIGPWNRGLNYNVPLIDFWFGLSRGLEKSGWNPICVYAFVLWSGF